MSVKLNTATVTKFPKREALKTVTFQEGGGKYLVDDEVCWPHILQLKMDKSTAISMITHLIQQIKDKPQGDMVTYFALGKLTTKA